VTITDLPITAVTAPVTLDLYKDIHKAIRVELFTATAEAGRLDPSHDVARASLAAHIGDIVELLRSHADHEDAAIQPALEAHLPDLAERVAVDHPTLEARLEDLHEMAGEQAAPGVADPAAKAQRLYLALASFTSDYLEHQDFEERVIMPSLEAAVGVEQVVGMHQAILASIPPDEMARSLAIMIPAMNIDDRTALLGGMRAGAPAEVFEGVWGLVGSVLERGDVQSLARRLDLA
jgi:hypothetical protein